MAFLWMELRTPNISAIHDTGEIAAIMSGCGAIGRIVIVKIEGVQEIITWVFDASK